MTKLEVEILVNFVMLSLGSWFSMDLEDGTFHILEKLFFCATPLRTMGISQ